MTYYIFHKEGFKKRQSQKLKDANSRLAILIDVHMQDDGKLLLLHEQKDYTLLGIYLHVLSNLDLETETWKVRADEFKSWVIRTFKVNNRFDVLGRLQWLSEKDLFDMEIISNDQIDPKQTTNKIQTNHQQDPNKGKTTSKQTLLEPAETLAPVISNNNQQTNQPTKEKEAPSLPAEFGEAVEYAYSHARSSMNNHSTGWVKPRLEEVFKQSEEPQFVLYCWKSACDTGWDKGQNYVKKVFSNKLNEGPSKQPASPQIATASSGKKLTDEERFMAAKVIRNMWDHSLTYNTADLEWVGNRIAPKGKAVLCLSEFEIVEP